MNLQPSLETSLDADLETFEQYQTYEEHIAMLKQNNRLTGMALRKAEHLIEEYSRQNEELRNANSALQVHVDKLQSQLNKLREDLREDEYRQNSDESQQRQDESHKTYQLIEDRIVELNSRHQQAQQRMGGLAQQLQKSEAKVAQLARLRQNEAESSLHHYFEFATPKNKKKDELQQVRSLKWRLEHREEQISFLLRRNKLLQQKVPLSSINKLENKYFQKIGKTSRVYGSQD